MRGRDIMNLDLSTLSITMVKKAKYYLPPEIVELIAAHLALRHPPTLWSLARASKTYYACCRPAINELLYRDIHIIVSESPQDLQASVSGLIARLNRTNGLRHVRQLLVRGPSKDTESEWRPPRLADMRYDSSTGTYIAHHGRWRTEPVPRLLPSWVEDLEFEDTRVEEIAHLMKQLPDLTDLIWQYYDAVPVSILQALDQYLPRCRLHLDPFWLPERPSGANLDGLSIFTSPSVHTVKATVYRELFSLFDWHSRSAYEDILHILSLAPNLEEAYLRDFVLPSQNEASFPRRAALKVLHLQGISEGNERNSICNWGHYTDLSVLETLIIDQSIHQPIIRWLSDGVAFSSLQCLSISFGCGPGLTRTMAFYEAANQWLLSLPPLHDLELAGWHSRIHFKALVSHHGSRLSRLRLHNTSTRQYLTGEEILCLAQDCSLLQELKIPLRRTQGDSEEVASYRALGAIQKLKYLSLDFQVIPVGMREQPREDFISTVQRFSINDYDLFSLASFDESENQLFSRSERSILRNGHVRRMIIDTIIDERLICAIYKAISDSKPPGSTVLEDLTISSTSVNDNFHDFRETINPFVSSWRIRRAPGYRHREKLIINAVQPANPNPGYDGRGPIEDEHRALPETVQNVFDQLFPGKKSKGPPRKFSKKLETKREKEESKRLATWTGRLHSFPLALAGGPVSTYQVNNFLDSGGAYLGV